MATHVSQKLQRIATAHTHLSELLQNISEACHVLTDEDLAGLDDEERQQALWMVAALIEARDAFINPDPSVLRDMGMFAA